MVAIEKYANMAYILRRLVTLRGIWQRSGNRNAKNMALDAAQIDARSTTAPPPKSTGKVRLLSLDRLDGRTMAARRAHELISSIEADLGGAAQLSEGSRQLVQRAAVLGTYIESCEAQWLGGEDVALGDYLAAINSQRRVLATIGLERQARNVTPSVAEYVAHIAADKEASAA
jgi:hypothetical protein